MKHNPSHVAVIPIAPYVHRFAKSFSIFSGVSLGA
jgi:hypothetical protein